MHPKKSLPCSIFPLFLAFLLWPSSSYTESLSDKIKRFVQSEADTLFMLPAEGLTLVRHSGNYFLFIQPVSPAKNFYNQGRKLTLFEASRGLLWEKTFNKCDMSEITNAENSPPKVTVGHLVDEATGVTEIYNTEGERLTEIRGPTALFPSPSGTYFHTVPSPMDGGALRVFDSLGNPLLSRFGKAGFWNVGCPSDSFLVYADDDSLSILSAKDGRILAGWPADSYTGMVDLASDFVASRNAKYFLLTEPAGPINSLFFFSCKDGFLWSAKYDWINDKEHLADIALSPDGRISAATFVPKERRTYRTLRFFDNLEKGKLITEFKFDVGVSYIHLHQKSSIRIFENIATIMLPSIQDFYSWKGVTDSTATKVFVFEPKNRTVVDTFTVKGYLAPVNSENSDSCYFQVTYDKENKKIFVLRSK